MQVHLFDDPSAFWQEAGAFLGSDPFSPNVIAVHVAAVLAGARPHHERDMWASVTEGRRVAGLAMHTPPHNLFVSRMSARAASKLAEQLARLGHEVPGVNGEVGAAAAFAGRWQQLKKRTPVHTGARRLYRLTKLSPPANTTGGARLAGPADVALVAGWMNAFHDEAMPERAHEEYRLGAEQKVVAREIVLWLAGEVPVSMAGFSKPAAGVARIGPVYTPPQKRRHGFASAATAAAARLAKEEGAKEVVLYTDLANPTSNAIYQAIGFRPDHDALELRFE